MGYSMTNTHHSDALPNVLQKTQEAQEKLESDARNLFVVNEVLKQELPDPVKATGDVAVALERSETIQSNIDAVAVDLDEVTNALAEEVARRKNAEVKLTETRAVLADTKADLADTKAQLAGANDAS
jgi:conjugal transfer/entry exclusion protein